MPKIRRSIPMQEMRDKAAAKTGRPDATTTYQASRGGWYPAPDKPVPGARKKR